MGSCHFHDPIFAISSLHLDVSCSSAATVSSWISACVVVSSILQFSPSKFGPENDEQIGEFGPSIAIWTYLDLPVPFTLARRGATPPSSEFLHESRAAWQLSSGTWGRHRLRCSGSVGTENLREGLMGQEDLWRVWWISVLACLGKGLGSSSEKEGTWGNTYQKLSWGVGLVDCSIATSKADTELAARIQISHQRPIFLRLAVSCGLQSLRPWKRALNRPWVALEAAPTLASMLRTATWKGANWTATGWVGGWWGLARVSCASDWEEEGKHILDTPYDFGGPFSRQGGG